MLLIKLVDSNLLSENLFSSADNNKSTVFNYIVDINSKAFTNMNRVQIESFALALFNNSGNYYQFKQVIRDFLISLKSFSGSHDELYEEEKKIQLDHARKQEESKRMMIPGMIPQYNNNQKFNVENYHN